MTAADPPPAARWFYGPVTDLTLGSGLLYVPIFLLLALSGSNLPSGLAPLLVLVLSTPHLGATLLRVYERPQDRRAYHWFAVHATIAIAVGFFVGLHVTAVGSLLITLYLTLVPWHFTGQNYGIALVLLRRRGIEVTPDLKRFVYACFALPYVLWVTALHTEQPATVEYAPLAVSGTVYQFLPLGIPGILQGPLLILTASLYVYALGGCALRLLERASVRDVLPGATLALTQGLWFAVPVLGRMLLPLDQMGPLAPGRAGSTFVWISLLHGVQYLWITAYYVKKERPGTKARPFLGKALLAGSAIYGFPVLILAPGVLGRLPFDAGLELMVAGALNLHHVLLDGVIWKLRNARIASILVRGVEEAAAAAPAARSWARFAVWASGALAVVLTIGGTLELEYGFQRAVARGDVARSERAATRLTWMGRDSADVRSRLAYLLLDDGDGGAAARELERSLALNPEPVAWLNLGVLRERDGNLPEALHAYEEALALDPRDVTALYYTGRASFKAGRVERARELLERAAHLAPERSDIRRTLDATRKRS